MAQQHWMAELQRVKRGDLGHLRDLLIDSFLETTWDSYAAAKSRLGLPCDNETLHQSVTRSVRQAMVRVGADFEHPSPADIEATIDELTRMAQAMGGDARAIALIRTHFLATLQRVAER